MSQETHILYICHDGVIPPLGQSQVLNLLLHLQGKNGIRFSLLSFEKDQDLALSAFPSTAQKLKEAEIPWIRLRYRRKPTGFATLWSVAEGVWQAMRVHRKDPIRILHARSYVPAAIASLVKSLTGIPFIFDMRGFWADEKVDVGTITKTSLPYRLAKRAESYLLRHADVIASLSRAGVREMERWPIWAGRHPRFEVVTTYANLSLFRLPEKRQEGRPFTVGYVGTAKGWYLFEPFLETFRAIKKKIPEARLVVLNRYEQEFLRERLSEFPSGDVEVKGVDHDHVPAEMGRMDASIFFIRPSYSKIASAPTKLGELLACGVPCLTNGGIGDVKEILNESMAGVVINGFSPAELEAGVGRLLALCREPETGSQCAKAAAHYFSLERGSKRYLDIYQSIP